MKLLRDNFVDSVMVFEGHKAESPLLASGPLLHDVDAFNLSILLKVLSDVVLLGVLLDTTDKDLLHRQMGTWFVGVLSGHGPLGFNNSAIHFMRPRLHGIIDFNHRGVSYEAKPS